MIARGEQARTGLGPLVGRTARSWRRAVDLHVHPFGLTEATWRPLLNISRATEPLRQKDLAASLGLDGSSIVRLLDSLQAAGLIERREGHDRRAKEIHLTAPGKEVVGRVEAAARQVRDSALGGLSDADVETAFRVLTHVCDALAALAAPVEEVAG